jgi:hemolysin III
MAISSSPFPSYSSAERRIDGAIHLIGTFLAPAGGIWLVLNAASAETRPGLLVYCLGLVAMLSTSALYNLASNGPKKEILRRMDHAVIFVMIAGTYTPLSLSRLDHTLGTFVLIAIWLCATIGVLLTFVFPRRNEATRVAFYLLMGWIVLIVIGPLSRAISETSLMLLVAGGVAYSVGAIFHLFERVPFHNSIWHGFVLTAAGLHFAAMAVEFAR